MERSWVGLKNMILGAPDAFARFEAWVQSHPVGPLPWALLAGWIIASLAYFKGSYSAKRFSLKEERPWILKAAAYAGAFPVRIVVSIFSGAVAVLVWGLLVFCLWAMVRAARG